MAVNSAISNHRLPVWDVSYLKNAIQQLLWGKKKQLGKATKNRHILYYFTEVKYPSDGYKLMVELGWKPGPLSSGMQCFIFYCISCDTMLLKGRATRSQAVCATLHIYTT